MRRPFLKWAGNKYSILDRLLPALPPGGRLVEPFVGSGAVFMNAGYASNLVADANPDLVALYRCLKNEGEAFIEAARAYFVPENNTKAAYYRLREEFNATGNRRKRALLFLYFNKHGYNGLCRYNSRGVFNVPFGRYKRPAFPERAMREYLAIASHTEVRHQDFRKTFAMADSGDVIYCDPPYVSLSQTADFTRYDGEAFTNNDQADLAELAETACRKGIPVFLSNHDTPLSRDLYRHASRIEDFDVQRYISCDGANRSKSPEILAHFLP